MGDRICLMDGGKIQQVGTPLELVFRPANAFVVRFLQEHLFQLQLQVLCLHQLRPFLPTVSDGAATAAVALHDSASVLEATQLLTATISTNQVLLLPATPEAPAQAATTASLMAAVAQLTPTLRA